MIELGILVQEADNWTSLSTDMEQVFASENIQAVEKVFGLFD